MTEPAPMGPVSTRQVVAVIPARFASERFPGKPLAEIDGVPMVVRVLRNVTAAESVDQVVVATDDDRIATVVRDAGGEAVLTPPELPSGSDRVWHVARDLTAEIVVNVQGDEPLLEASVVDALVSCLRGDARAEIATPVVRVPRSSASTPDVVTVARDEDGRSLYFSRSTIPSGTDDVWRHIGVYAYRTAALERFVAAPPTALERTEKLEQLRALSLGLYIAAVEVGGVTHAVDRPGDVEVVEALLHAPASGLALGDVRLVALDVDGVLTDGRISYVGREQLQSFDVKDGSGIVALRAAGIEVAIISGRDSTALRHRAEELGIRHVRTSVTDKALELSELCATLEIPLAETCFVGDDLPDLPAMALAGYSAVPADALPVAKAAATLVLRRPGGRGAVRELADLLLQSPRESAEETRA